MFRRRPKRPRDVNQIPYQIVAESVGDAEKTPAPERTLAAAPTGGEAGACSLCFSVSGCGYQSVAK